MKNGKFLKIASFTILFILAVVRLVGLTSTLNRLEKQNEEINTKLNTVKQENESLKSILNSINTDEIKDKNARERLNKIKKGEIPVINSQP